MLSQTLLAFGFLFLWVNVPMAIAYVWRRFTRKRASPVYLGFEGPIVCTLLMLAADTFGPFPWIHLALPWVFHFGTWELLLRGLRRLFAPRVQRHAPS